jgi:hypothetical protein
MSAENFSDNNRAVVAAYRDGVMFALGDPLPVESWRQLMVAALSDPTDANMRPTYNNFDPVRVADKLARFQITIQPAREYSVAVYIRGDADALATIARMAKRWLLADEVHACERLRVPDSDYPQRGQSRHAADVLRLWWD